MPRRANRSFVLKKVQPALLGLMDGSVSTLAPIFAAVGLTGKPQNAFFVGLAASLGAGISMVWLKPYQTTAALRDAAARSYAAPSRELQQQSAECRTRSPSSFQTWPWRLTSPVQLSLRNYC